MDNTLNWWYRNGVMESIESQETESVAANTETIQDTREDTAGTLDEEESPELD